MATRKPKRFCKLFLYLEADVDQGNLVIKTDQIDQQESAGADANGVNL